MDCVGVKLCSYIQELLKLLRGLTFLRSLRHGQIQPPPTPHPKAHGFPSSSSNGGWECSSVIDCLSRVSQGPGSISKAEKVRSITPSLVHGSYLRQGHMHPKPLDYRDYRCVFMVLSIKPRVCATVN